MNNFDEDDKPPHLKRMRLEQHEKKEEEKEKKTIVGTPSPHLVFLNRLKPSDAVIDIHVVCANEIVTLLADTRRRLFGTRYWGTIHRNIQQKRLNKFIKYLQEWEGEFVAPITLAKLGSRWAILDGAHRFVAAQIMCQEFTPVYLTVQIIRISSLFEYETHFRMLNDVLPQRTVRNITSWKNVLHQLETHFTERYSRYIEYEQAKFGVTLPLENLLRHMDRSEWVKRVNVPVRIIISEVESLNDFYLRTWQNVMQFEKADSLVKRCVDQCPERPLLLGIYTQFEWLERIESRLLSLRHHIAQPESVLTYSQMDHPTITSSQATNAANHQVRPTRKRIPKALRRRVWTKRNGTEIIGRCFTCGCSIDYDAFECGHVVAAARGGKAILSNLEPICGVCNRDMQTTNLHSYRAEMTTLI